jgi:LPPG:FO 2-phospho-L-lactate transferase
VITVLSGGVGAARLLRALSDVVDPHELVAVVNVGDDLVLHGLTICPDLDTITYTLAGLNNDVLGWGLNGESWRVMEELDRLGGEAWFRLGDRDLATHLYRSERLRQGATKTQVTRELAAHYELAVTLLPVSDDPLATEFLTPEGRLAFQDYFVRRHHDVVVSAIEFVGAENASLSAEARDAITSADRLVIAPSNPLISIDPILQVPGVRELIRERASDVIAVSPLINGEALKGPADRLMRELGYESSVLGVADFYEGLVGTWVIDEADRALAEDLRARGVNVEVTTTIMADPENARRLAKVVVS